MSARLLDRNPPRKIVPIRPEPESMMALNDGKLRDAIL